MHTKKEYDRAVRDADRFSRLQGKTWVVWRNNDGRGVYHTNSLAVFESSRPFNTHIVYQARAK